MTADAPAGLADAIVGMRNDLADSLFAQAVVTDAAGRGVTVDMMGTTSTWPRLHSYHPVIGDVVLMAGSPDSWVCLGSLEAVGPAQTFDLDVDGNVSINGDLTVDQITTTGDVQIGTHNLGCQDIFSRDIFARDIGCRGISTTGDVQLNGHNLGVGSIFAVGATFSGNANASSFSSGTTTLNAAGFIGPGASFTGNCNANSFAAGSSQMTTAGFIGAGCSFTGNGNAGSWSSGPSSLSALGVVAPGASFSGNCNAGSFSPYPSSRSIKRNICHVSEELERTPLELIRNAPVQAWEYDPAALTKKQAEVLPTDRRIGPMVDDMPALAVVDGPHGPAPELGAMTNLAWGAIQELSAIVDKQAARIDALERRLAAVEGK